VTPMIRAATVNYVHHVHPMIETGDVLSSASVAGRCHRDNLDWCSSCNVVDTSHLKIMTKVRAGWKQPHCGASAPCYRWTDGLQSMVRSSRCSEANKVGTACSRPNHSLGHPCHRHGSDA